MLSLYPEVSLSLLSRASISTKLLLFLPLASAHFFQNDFLLLSFSGLDFVPPFCASGLFFEHTSLLLSAFHSSRSWCQGHSAPGLPQHIAHNSAMICWVSATVIPFLPGPSSLRHLPYSFFTVELLPTSLYMWALISDDMGLVFVDLICLLRSLALTVAYLLKELCLKIKWVGK